MASGFLKRQDVQYPQQSNPRDIYAVKMIEDADLNTLETFVNLYLLTLPDQTKDWVPHIIDTQLLHYGTGGGARFVMKITVYVSGTVNAVPI
jgi:hypothetical protein